MFQRIAIVNRGEAAMRLIHAVRDLNAARPGSTAASRCAPSRCTPTGERDAMFVREADEAYDLGPAADRPYLDHAVLEHALRRDPRGRGLGGLGLRRGGPGVRRAVRPDRA